jgi:hypothetical protein
MDECVMKPETLRDSKGPQVGITNRERRPERLKYRVIAKAPAEYADWIQVQWPAAIRRTDRFEHMRAGKYYSLSLGDKLL